MSTIEKHISNGSTASYYELLPEKAFPVATIQANNLVAELVKAGMELKEAA